MPFRPGESGNPRGRPRKGLAAADVVSRHISPDDLIKRAIAILDHPKTGIRERVEIIKVLTAYSLGRPATTIDLNVGLQENQWIAPSNWDSLSPAQRGAYLDQMRARALAGVVDVDGEESDEP